MAKGTGDEAMVPAAADFGEVGNGKEVGFEEAIFGAWGSEGGAEGEVAGHVHHQSSTYDWCCGLLTRLCQQGYD